MLNNDGYLSIKVTQKTFFNGHYVASEKSSGVSFPDFKKENLGYPLSSVKFTAYGKEITLEIYDKREEKKYFASSSESPYVFTITEWNGKKFFLDNIIKSLNLMTMIF